MMDMDFKLFLRIFLIFCLIFGLINVCVGGVALYGYYKVHDTLSATSLEVSQGISSAKALFSNATELASTASSEVKPAVQNITMLLSGLENEISISKQAFYNESDYFSSFTFPDSSPQQSAGVSTSFKTIANELNMTQNQYFPMIRAAVDSAALKANGSISGLNTSISRLNQSLSLIADNALSEIGTANSLISMAILGFAIYSILEGIVFIMLSVFILYLIKNLYDGGKQMSVDEKSGSTSASYKDVDAVRSNVKSKAKPKATVQSESEQEPEKSDGKTGILKRVKDTFGIEE